MSTKDITIPRTLQELESMSEDEVAYLAQRAKIPAKLEQRYGIEKIRDLLDRQERLPSPEEVTRTVQDELTGNQDMNDYETWTNSQLRTEIMRLSEALGEDPDLDGKKSVLVERVTELQQRVDEESDEDDESEDDNTEEL